MAANLPKALSEKAFRGVWKTSRDGKGSHPGKPGIDGLRAEEFSSNLANHISRIRHEIALGHYRFSSLRPAPIVKKSGKIRIIAIPTVRDRLVQRAIIKHLENDPRFSEKSAISYGFLKDRKLSDAPDRAIELRSRHNWVLQTDIIKFFDQIDRSDLNKNIAKIRSKTIRDLIIQCIRCEIDSKEPGLNKLVSESGIVSGRGLRQGMPLSPLLSNLVLKDFDKALQADGLRAIRYADDIAVFCDSESECRAALTFLKKSLAELKLKIPDLDEEDKTKIYGPTESAEFLGLEIRWSQDGYILCAPEAKLIALEARMKEIASLAYCTDNRRDLGQVVRTLDSIIGGYDGVLIKASNKEKFLDRARIQRKHAIEGLLVELFGQQALSKLNRAKRAVLGIETFTS